MSAGLFDDPRFLAGTRFKRQAQQLEYTDKADLQKVLVNLLVDPLVGEKRPDGSFQIAFGAYVLRYSLLDEEDPHSKISLDDLRVV